MDVACSLTCLVRSPKDTAKVYVRCIFEVSVKNKELVEAWIRVLEFRAWGLNCSQLLQHGTLSMKRSIDLSYFQYLMALAGGSTLCLWVPWVRTLHGLAKADGQEALVGRCSSEALRRRLWRFDVSWNVTHRECDLSSLLRFMATTTLCLMTYRCSALHLGKEKLHFEDICHMCRMNIT